MHYRPVHLKELETLEEKRRKIGDLIASARRHLSDEERAEIAKLTKEIRDVYAQLAYEYTEKDTYTMIYHGLRRARNAVIVGKLLSEIETSLSDGRITAKDSLELRAVAFHQLQAITAYKLEYTQPIILNELLPLCLRDTPSLSVQYGAFRKVLSEWIGQHPQPDSNELRNAVIDTVIPLIGGENHNPACLVLSTIGYSRPDIVKTLLDFASNTDNEAGDIAISTLTWIGLSMAERKAVLSELHRRAEKHYNHHLVWSVARLSDPSSFPVMLAHWLSPTARPVTQVDPSLAFTAIREIASANDSDHFLQDSIWAETTKLVEQDPKTLYWDFDIGNIVVGCNSPDVVRTMLTWHGQHPDWFENPGWAHYLVQERLERCVKPRQLEGWTQIEEQTIFELLRQDACLNTKDDSFSTTQEAMTKEIAWKTLLRTGYEEALSWFDAAVVGETGRFIRQKLMKYLACFRIDPLPDAAIRWITEVYDHPSGSDGREISYRMAAVQMARSTTTETALEHLLNFGFTYNGQVLTQSSDAVAEVALSLIRQGNTTVVDHIARMLIRSGSSHQRLVCVSALETIASFPEYQHFLLPYTEEFIPLIYDESRDPIERGSLLNTLGHLTEWVIPEHLVQDLIAWAHQPDRWIGGGSLEILASHGHLEKRPELMGDVLGLEPDGDFWRLASTEVHFEWAPYIIGLLYHRDPQAYTPAIVSLLSNRDWQPAAQIIRWLDATHGNDGQPDVPKVVAEALIRRTHERYSLLYGETEIFDVLARLAPNALIEHKWNEVVAAWMPDTRVALANALRKVVAPQDSQGQCLVALEMLTEDGLYPVRRAAYRGLAKQSTTYLYKLCQTWLASPFVELNLRAAEACGWIENVKPNNGQDGFAELYQQCTSHPEPGIREAVHRSWEERRQRLWSREYLGKVMGVEGKDNSEVLRTWCYGDALSQIGDDECREILLDHVSGKPLPPNIRYWIKHILEELETNWKKTTQKWPDPWADMGGAIERGKGRLISSSNKMVDMQYSIWQVPAVSPREKHSWGGVMIASFEHFLDLGKVFIELEGGRKGEILFTGFTGNTGTFFGASDYPKLN